MIHKMTPLSLVLRARPQLRLIIDQVLHIYRGVFILTLSDLLAGKDVDISILIIIGH